MTVEEQARLAAGELRSSVARTVSVGHSRRALSSRLRRRRLEQGVLTVVCIAAVTGAAALGASDEPLLDGFRGSVAADVDSLVQLVLACGRLAEEVPLVAELDLNPVMVSASGCQLVDVKLRLAPNRSVGADEPRQLRRTSSSDASPLRGRTT